MKKVLIIDDDKILLRALSDKFQREGYEVIAAADGNEGLQKITGVDKPDIVLLDIVMPVKDGITMLKEMRAMDFVKDIPVILLTNLSDATNTMQAVQNGVHDYLIKSDWKIDDVVKVVAERIG